MSGIFGIFYLNDTPVTSDLLATMHRNMAHWGPDGTNQWLEGPVGLGQELFISTPEACYERLPSWDATHHLAFTAAARVDNRAELGRALNISLSDQARLPDSEFIRRSYLRWGKEAPGRIYGDWAFAAYHPLERRLFLARDHFGNTALYYYVDPQVFAFASSRRALLALNLAPIKMDELYLAQVLISWPAYHGDHTIHQPLHRLPPAHYLSVTPERLAKQYYWRLEETPELHLPGREDYVAAFQEVFDEAVRSRLRSPGPIATTLSGGLDSSSVTVTAASFLHKEGKRLQAFTSIPLSDTCCYVGDRLGDEFPFAQATANYTSNVDLHPVSAADLGPIQAIQEMLEIINEPGHAAGNFYWIIELERGAQAHGCRVLLTGQMGNAGISWTGDIFSQPLACQLHHFGYTGWVKKILPQAKTQIKKLIPPDLLRPWQLRRQEYRSWWRASAIHPDFAHRLQLLEQRLRDPDEQPPRTPQERRYRILQPGRSLGGALHAEMGASYGIEVRDPTADARVLALTLSVPDHIFVDQVTGQDRWLIRQAMQGRLLDVVRLNRRRGRQAGDLVPRLRSDAAAVENALAELSRGPAADYVDVSYMRQVWQNIQAQDTATAFRQAITVLTRGIMAGLFVNGFYHK